MTSHFTLGIEEEFQIVDRTTGQLVSHVHTLLERGAPLLGEHIKAEMLQSFVELSTGVCPDITTLRLDLQQKITVLTGLLELDGLTIIRSGTHPTAHWQEQQRTQHIRYEELEEEFQDVARSILIFGMHVHVGLEKHEMAVPLMNQARTWLPHILALSSNSPFWHGHNSGLKSYRSIIWKRFPRSGIPNTFSSTAELDQYVENLIATGCIDNAKKIWWDVRPHPFFNTLEFRICDMPATLEDSLAIAALCQALVAKLTWLYKRNLHTAILPSRYIEENKWRAARYGLDAEFVDFPQQRRLSLRDSVSETLDFVDELVDELGTRQEMNYIRALLEDPRGTGADRQLAIYHETGNVQAVTSYLIKQSCDGLALHPRC